MNIISSLYPLFMGLGAKEIIIIALVIVLLFGAKKIPELMKGLGSGIKEFKKSVKEEETDNNKKTDNNTQ